MRKLLILFIFLLSYSCSQEEGLNGNDENNTTDEATVKISSDFISIQKDKIKSIEYDTNQETLLIDINDDDIKLDLNKVISFEFNGMTYIRKIQEISSKNPYVIKTTHADLTDIFIDGEFTLSSELPSEKSRNSETNVFYPEKIVYENGETLYLNSSRAEVSGRIINNNFDLTSLNDRYDFDFFEIEDGNIYTNLDFKLKFNFDSDEEAKEVIKGKLIDLTTSLVGSVGFNCNSRFFIESSFAIEDIDKTDKENLIKPFTIWFNVSGVSIPVIVNMDLMHDFELEAEGGISCSFGAAYEMQSEVGINYNQATQKTTPFFKREETINVDPPTVSVDGKMACKYSIYPKFKFYIYDVLGPEIDVKPYVQAEVGFSATHLQEYDIQALNFKSAIGLEMESKVSAELFSLNYDVFEMPDVELFSKGLYESPYKIEIEGIDKENNILSYTVYDTIPILQKVMPTPLSSPVLLHSSSNNYYETQYTNNGMVSVSLDGVSCMNGSIFNVDGKVIDNAVYGLCDAVDLGLSVLWCSHNYGVDTPEGFSEYLTHSEAQAIADNDKLGWRLPTESELKELCEKCNCENVTVNGKKGNKFTGPNRNSIFIPRMGYYEGGELIGHQSPYVEQTWYLGRYWGYDYAGSNEEGVGYYESLELSYNRESCTTDKKGTYRMPIRMVIDKEDVENLVMQRTQ